MNPESYNSQVIEERLRLIIAERLGLDEKEITQDKSFADDFGADSLDIYDLVVMFEDEFKLDIPESELGSMRTVGDAVSYITRTVEQSPSA